MPLTIPSIHLNGTSKESLLEAIETAYHAVSHAQGALAQTAPHARDYYVQGPTVIYKATDEHMSRMKRLQSVKDELQALAEAIHDGGHKV